MNIANITKVPKKGSKFLLKNERGIFRVSVQRTILMRLIYNRKYPDIDKNISDCQMGARGEKMQKQYFCNKWNDQRSFEIKEDETSSFTNL